ncbi:hypothetical protein [Methylobacterium nonmethylotrophicum]|uniref:hypothetical protein n=1 Tax=Methylobacterium nonmethylotrophicum TaxID=1141884 RepID=UPI001436936E|nr:hypothetical protein [Methylobacterium nonmethylotrophicum]
MTRTTKPHTSVRMSRAALRELNIISAMEGVSNQKILENALRQIFADRGRNFDVLNAKA